MAKIRNSSKKNIYFVAKVEVEKKLTHATTQQQNQH